MATTKARPGEIEKASRTPGIAPRIGPTYGIASVKPANTPRRIAAGRPSTVAAIQTRVPITTMLTVTPRT